MSLIEMLTVAGVVVLLTLISVMVGAYVVYKMAKSVPGERFLGGVPKGQVFSVKDVEDAEEFPPEDEAEKHVLQRTEAFLKALEGGKQQ
jgi:hypothetical protein